MSVDTYAETDEREYAGPRLWQATSLLGTEQPEWLAKHRLPRAAVSILVGDEGIGKSLFWVWIAAAVTRGEALPEFGLPARPPGRVCLVITEDHWSYTVRPRLEAAGADLDRISVICSNEDGTGSPVFPRDMHLVRESGADLVVVDAFLDTVAANISMKDPQQARLALHPWTEAATDTGSAILLLTHTNRIDSKNARDRYGITGELRKKARMTLYAQEDEAGQLVIGPEKSNITMKVPASIFRIDAVRMFEPTDEHDGTVPLLKFVGESDKTAGQHLEANFAAAHDDITENGSEAEAWLADYLTLNPDAPSKEVKAAARRDAGISERTLKRAANTLRVVTKSEGFPRTTTWSLPFSEATTTARVSGTGPTGPTGSDNGKHVAPLEQLGQSGHTESNGPTAVPTGVPTGRECPIHHDEPRPDACWTCEQIGERA